MTQEDRDKVIGHAMDHVAYRWTKGLPVRHDRRDWTQEEIDLYNATYDKWLAVPQEQMPPRLGTLLAGMAGV